MSKTEAWLARDMVSLAKHNEWILISSRVYKKFGIHYLKQKQKKVLLQFRYLSPIIIGLYFKKKLCATNLQTKKI